MTLTNGGIFMNKMVWVSVSISVLSSLQAVAQEKTVETIDYGQVQFIGKTPDGDYIINGKDGDTIIIDKKIIETLKKNDFDSAPAFERSSPCVVFLNKSFDGNNNVKV
jgi:hypothetical protein